MGRREPWFIDLINTHLSAPSDPKSPAAIWQLSPPTFYRLLNAIFSNVRKKLDSDKREAMIERHGVDKIAKLEGILTTIAGRA